MPLIIVSCNVDRRGIAIVLAVTVVGVTLAAAMTIAAIFIGQYRISADIVQSTQAIMAADAGAERALFARQREDFSLLGYPLCGACSGVPAACSPSPFVGILGVTSFCAAYDFDDIDSDPLNVDYFGVGDPNVSVIRSAGAVGDIRRAFEVRIEP